MRPMLLVALILVGLVVVACGGGSEGSSSDDVAGSDPDRPDPGAVASVDTDRAEENLEAREGTAFANAAFALDLYRELVVDGENFVFSPYSAAVALGMARAGARGQTAAEMDAVLHADLAGDLNAGFNAIDRALARRPGEFETFDGSLTLELSTANAIWSQIGLPLEAGFLEVLGRDYGAGVRLVDYAQDTEGARQAINGWVSDQTNERIPMLVAPGVVTASTRLVLT
ncbi:MAG: serpin family protein, partial [Chloroflexi bacterium]|nr:serpin family protein [Chloroflexota bacterium]